MHTAKDILERKGSQVHTIAASASVLEAAERMNRHRIGSLVVTRENRVVGIFTERDILTRVVALNRTPADTWVADVMTSPTACCRRDTTAEECRTIMTQRRIRHLPVVEGGTLHGLISSGDILALEAADQQHAIEYLHEYMFNGGMTLAAKA